MRILIISHYFPPFNVVASQRPYSWAKAWQQAGHTVTVLTTAKPQRPDDLQLECSGIEVIAPPIPFFSTLLRWLDGKRKHRNHPAYNPPAEVRRRPGLLRRLLRHFQTRYGIFITSRMPDWCDLWIAPACRAIAGRSFDLIVSTSGPYACHLVARKIKRQSGGFWIADFRDLWTDNHIFPGLFPFRLIERRLERNCLETADIITTVSHPLAGVLRRRNESTKVEVVENGFDPSELEKLSAAPYWPNDNKIRLLYTGTIYSGKRDPSPLFAAIGQLQDEHCSGVERLEVVFACKQDEYLQDLAKRSGVLASLRLPGYVRRCDSLRMQRDADVLLFLESGEASGILTGKLFEYLWSGTEIWAIGVTPANESGAIIAAAHAGQCFGNDIEKIAAALRKLLSKNKKIAVTPTPAILNKFHRKDLALRMLGFAQRD